MVSEDFKIIFFYVVMFFGPYINPPIKPNGSKDPRVWCWSILTYSPRGMVCMIYIVNHYVLLHNKHRSCRFMVSKDFLSVIPQ